MKLLHHLKLSQRFAVLVATFILGFVVYGAGSFITLNELKVNGPHYQNIIRGKDLIADILPPPEYIIESYLVSLQLFGAGEKESRDKLIERFKVLKGEYDTRHEYWQKSALENEFRDIFLRRAHEPAIAFYKTAFDEFIPAVQKDDEGAAVAALERMKLDYAAHRKIIDEVVVLATKHTDAHETEARERIQTASMLLLANLIISLGVSIVVAVSIVRSLLASLGGEPEYAVKIAHAIADCDLSVRVDTKPGDNSSLLAAMKVMQGGLSKIIGNVNDGVDQLAQAAGRLSASAGRVAAGSSQQRDDTQA
ncbi:MAG: methyl-accepting chemotaxis protein, partial [Sulfuricellaceae bacterium]